MPGARTRAGVAPVSAGRTSTPPSSSPPAGRAPVVIPRPLRHPLQKILWGIGLLAAANASTVTSTYAGQVVMDGFMGWKVSEGALACAGLP